MNDVIRQSLITHLLGIERKRGPLVDRSDSHALYEPINVVASPAEKLASDSDGTKVVRKDRGTAANHVFRGL